MVSGSVCSIFTNLREKPRLQAGDAPQASGSA